MAFNPMDMFQAGGELGKANVSPFNYGAGNIMDRFNAVNDAGMKMALQAEMFKNQKNYEWSNSPQSREANAKLNASGLGPGGPGGVATQTPLGSAGEIGGQPSGLGSNVETKFTNVQGQTFENMDALAKQKMADELIKQHGDMVSAGNAVDQIAALQKMYESGMQGNFKKDPARGSNPLTAALQSGTQSANMWANQLTNSDWQKYQSFKKNTSYFSDRYVWGEKGKLIGQQLDAGIKTLPDGSTFKTPAYGKFSEMYNAAGRPISSYNKQVQQIFGPNSQYEIHPQEEKYIEKQHDRAVGLSHIQNATGEPVQIGNAFKNKWQEDL